MKKGTLWLIVLVSAELFSGQTYAQRRSMDVDIGDPISEVRREVERARRDRARRFNQERQGVERELNSVISRRLNLVACEVFPSPESERPIPQNLSQTIDCARDVGQRTAEYSSAECHSGYLVQRITVQVSIGSTESRLRQEIETAADQEETIFSRIETTEVMSESGDMYSRDIHALTFVQDQLRRMRTELAGKRSQFLRERSVRVSAIGYASGTPIQIGVSVPVTQLVCRQ